jgi:DNA-binding transcriptional ArsR family regulator
MAGTDQRLRRLLVDERGECCDGDLQQRREELRDLAETALDADVMSVFGVLGNETRYRLARLLSAGGERCVCELDPLVDVSESAVSHALSDLVDAGLAERRKEGNWRYYRSTRLADELFGTAEEYTGTDE